MEARAQACCNNKGSWLLFRLPLWVASALPNCQEACHTRKAQLHEGAVSSSSACPANLCYQVLGYRVIIQNQLVWQPVGVATRKRPSLNTRPLPL